MSGDFLTDHADDPYVAAMAFPVLVFAVLCFHPVARVQPFISADGALPWAGISQAVGLKLRNPGCILTLMIPTQSLAVFSDFA
jgi:hypothetical protein